MTYKFSERSLMPSETNKLILQWVTSTRTLAMVVDGSTGGTPYLCRSFPGKTSAPTAGDDSGDGYIVGDIWVDETNDKAYICLDNSVGVATWAEITASGGGSGDMTKAVYDTDNDGVVDNAEALAGTTPTAAGLALLDDADAAAQRTTLGLGTMAVEAASDYVAKSLYDANTVLAATADNTPAAVTIGEAQIVGRQVGGNIGGIAQVSTAEKTAGTETALRAFSPKDVADMASTHGGGGGGDMELISDAVLTSNVASISLTSIPATYKHLMLVMNVRSDTVDTDDAIYFRCNGDSGNVYNGLLMFFYHSASMVSIEQEATNYGLAGVACAANSPTNAFGGGSVIWADYANTTTNKTVFGNQYYDKNTSSGGNRIGFIGSSWSPSTPAAISSIVLTLRSGGNFLAGSRVSLYGFN